MGRKVNTTAYAKGWYAGFHGYPTSVCPYEDVFEINDWIGGHCDGILYRNRVDATD